MAISAQVQVNPTLSHLLDLLDLRFLGGRLLLLCIFVLIPVCHVGSTSFNVSVHNETLNIWTYLLGAVFAIDDFVSLVALCPIPLSRMKSINA